MRLPARDSERSRRRIHDCICDLLRARSQFKNSTSRPSEAILGQQNSLAFDDPLCCTNGLRRIPMKKIICLLVLLALAPGVHADKKKKRPDSGNSAPVKAPGGGGRWRKSWRRRRILRNAADGPASQPIQRPAGQDAFRTFHERQCAIGPAGKISAFAERGPGRRGQTHFKSADAQRRRGGREERRRQSARAHAIATPRGKKAIR